MKRNFLPNFIIALSFYYGPASAQTGLENLSAVIKQKDSLFWVAYNNCEPGKFRQFFTEDVEFYHDKGGITLGEEKLTLSFKNNLCSNDSLRVRREAVPGTMKVFPMQNGNTVYGAITMVEHVFYVLEKGKKERLDGLAKSTHLWLLKDSVWKMSRVLSFDHGPAPSTNPKK